MSRSLATILITLGLIAGAAGAYAPAAHAQQATTTNSSPSASVQTAAGANNAVTPPADPPKNADFGAVMTWIMGLFAWLLGVAMLLLDNTVFYTVATMGTYVHNLSAVGIAWRVLRDVGNIVLIFGFLAIGITTILDVKWYGGGTKMLPMLLVAAVFLNFSLFISEAIIDTGNLFATEFYTQINGGNLPQAPNFTLANISNEGISNKIMSQLGFQSIYGDAVNHPAALTGSNAWIIGFMGIILFMVAAFVMFSLAFVLITRFIILIFLIIVAPIGFAGLAVPKLTGLAKDWWEMLFKQTITAPVLLLLLYIALKVITDQSFLTGFNVSGGPGGTGTSWIGFINNANLTGFGGVMLSFIVAMGLLLAVVISAKTMSASGAGWATKTAGAATFGLLAAAGRNTAGRASQYTSRKLKTSSLGHTAAGRLGAGILDRGAKASFDMRGTGVLRNLPRGGIDAGAAQKGGYKAKHEAAIKGHQDYIKSVGEAIDERGMEKVTEAQKARYAAQTKSEPLKEVKETAAKQNEKNKSELVALEEAEKSRTRFGVKNSPEEQHQLDTARQNFAQSTESLATATKNFEKSSENLETAQKKEQDINAGISKEKKTAQLAYAESIKGLGGSMYGPGAGAAANKIVKDTLKNEDKLGAIKKIIGEEKPEVKNNGSQENKGEEKPKPEAGH